MELRFGVGDALGSLLKIVVLAALQFAALFLIFPHRQTFLTGGMRFLPVRKCLILRQVPFQCQCRKCIAQARVSTCQAGARKAVASGRRLFESSNGLPKNFYRRVRLPKRQLALGNTDVAESEVGFRQNILWVGLQQVAEDLV